MHILICEFMDEQAVDRLRESHTVVYEPNLVDDAPSLLKKASLADALVVRNRTQVRGPLLDALGHCRVVARLGVGLDNIDVAACEARGLVVIPATGANALSVAEYVIASAMLLLRGGYTSTAAVAAGQWPRAALSQGREVAGKTLGLVGFGHIGQLTARLAKAIGMHVIAHDAFMAADAPAYGQSGVRCVDLDELVARADVISLHVPLVDSTRGLFDATRLGQMKPGAVLINTARGGVVDELAVAVALKGGSLGGAAIDVFETEPLPASPHWQGCPNLVLTPHIAGVTTESNERVSHLIADQLLKALK
ncbi:hydroxyacid dehydrogenase [Hydrogenophaga sp.]|uniref:hydroxyacid dehydrogenase n=1 Tax=Hydrogenophaga sp. TaxID=1904254 RepID=UPI0025BB8F13|nr:hydroxyacid dehydrogenase [Hydrogenophaga sp.]